MIKTPENRNKERRIEDCFEPKLLKTKIDGKTFNAEKKLDPSQEYGKVVFAEKVVRANANSVKFDGFDPLLNRITQAIQDYKAPETGYEKLQKIVDAAEKAVPVKAKAASVAKDAT